MNTFKTFTGVLYMMQNSTYNFGKEGCVLWENCKMKAKKKKMKIGTVKMGKFHQTPVKTTWKRIFWGLWILIIAGHGEEFAVPDPGRHTLPPLQLGATQVRVLLFFFIFSKKNRKKSSFLSWAFFKASKKVLFFS